MELKISVLSQPGGREINEDAYGVWSSPEASFFILADGAGGHRGGEVASKLAVQQVLDWFHQTGDCSAAGVEAALDAANKALVRAQKETLEYADMRTTAVVLVIDSVGGTAVWGHIGDSRLYCFRQRRIIVQTQDHSIVQTMVDAGYMRPADLRHSPQRNALFAALGDADSFQPSIQTVPFRIEHGDIFLLCTDGFWEHVSEAGMEASLLEADSTEAWLQSMEANVANSGKAGYDNYSALVVACNSSDVPHPVPEEQSVDGDEK
jgi:serine/threonine protein phosphatase PrpC